MKDVEQAAREANALDFIKTLPSGFDTNCGKKGSQLSGNVSFCSNSTSKRTHSFVYCTSNFERLCLCVLICSKLYRAQNFNQVVKNNGLRLPVP